MTPPTAATSSTMEVTSKASRWSERKRVPISAGEPKAPSTSAVVLSASSALRAMTTTTSSAIAPAATTAATDCSVGPAGPGRVRAPAEVGDDEEEHDHDGARVDEHLRGGDELGREQQIEDRERDEVPDQGERAVEGVREEHHGEAAGEERERRDDPDEPDEDVRGRGGEHDLGHDSAFQTDTGVS